MIDWSDPEATKAKIKPTVTRTSAGWTVSDPLAPMLTEAERKQRVHQALTDMVTDIKMDDEPPLPLKPWVPQ